MQDHHRDAKSSSDSKGPEVGTITDTGSNPGQALRRTDRRLCVECQSYRVPQPSQCRKCERAAVAHPESTEKGTESEGSEDNKSAESGSAGSQLEESENEEARIEEHALEEAEIEGKSLGQEFVQGLVKVVEGPADLLDAIPSEAS